MMTEEDPRAAPADAELWSGSAPVFELPASIEYALLVALIAFICIVAIAFLGQSASTKFSTVGSSIGS